MTKTVRVAMVSVWCVSAAFAAPKVRIEPVALDFGTVKAGAQADRVLEVHNDGDAPLRVLRAKGSCGCTRVDLPEGGAAEVAPGGAMHLTVRFDSAGRAGKQSSVAAITTNDPERPAVTVPITAFVEALTIVRPPGGLTWQHAARGGAVRRTVVIVPGDATKDIEPIGIASGSPALTASAAKVVRNGQQMIDVKFALAKDAPLGELIASVEARVRVAGEETIVTIPARGTVVGDIVVTPREVYRANGAVARGAAIGEILVRSSGEGTAPEIGAIETIGPVRAERAPAIGEDVRKITVIVADGAPAGPCSGTVVIMSSSVDEPVVRVPVYFEAAPRVAVQPREVVLGPAHPVQRIELRAEADGAMTIQGVAGNDANGAIIRAAVVAPKHERGGAPAIIEVSVADVTAAEVRGAVLRVTTDVPGEEAVYIPVLVRP